MSRTAASSAQNSRRLQPQPHDFSQTMARFGQSPRGLSQDLSWNFMGLRSQTIEPSDSKATDAAFLLNTGVYPARADAESTSRAFPSHFPLLPPTHSYKDTPIITTRENDARKVRELATREGMQAEQALRKLMVARQSQKKTLTVSHINDAPTSTYMKSEGISVDALFSKALASMLQKDAEADEHSQQEQQEDLRLGEADRKTHSEYIPPTDIDFGAIVNHDKPHWRKRAALTA